jgi:hypothetical protein
MIPSQACRDAFWQLGTKRQLDTTAVEKVAGLRVLPTKSRDLAEIYADLPTAKQTFDDWARGQT